MGGRAQDPTGHLLKHFFGPGVSWPVRLIYSRSVTPVITSWWSVPPHLTLYFTLLLLCQLHSQLPVCSYPYWLIYQPDIFILAYPMRCLYVCCCFEVMYSHVQRVWVSVCALCSGHCCKRVRQFAAAVWQCCTDSAHLCVCRLLQISHPHSWTGRSLLLVKSFPPASMQHTFFRLC